MTTRSETMSFSNKYLMLLFFSHLVMRQCGVSNLIRKVKMSKTPMTLKNIVSSASPSSWHWKKVCVFGELSVVVRQSPVVKLFAPEYAQARGDVCRGSGCCRLSELVQNRRVRLYLTDHDDKTTLRANKTQRRCG